MTKNVVIRRALAKYAPSVNKLLTEWFDWHPANGRLESISKAIGNGEILVAQVRNEVVGFIHYIMHEDIIDGGPNSFISAFYVSHTYRGKGIGTLLLEAVISASLTRGAVGVETSTIHARAKRLYERHHFKQTVGDIREAFLELDVDEYLSTRSWRKEEPLTLVKAKDKKSRLLLRLRRRD